MLYDNCASGGRRNDLESMRRGVPFTKSDYALEPVGVQCETYGISLWLPYYAATWMWNEDPYTCRSNMAHVTGALLKIDDKNHGKQLPKRLDEWRKTVANYYGSSIVPKRARGWSKRFAASITRMSRRGSAFVVWNRTPFIS